MRSVRLNKSTKAQILDNVVKVWLTKNPPPDIAQAQYDLALFALKYKYPDFDEIMAVYKKHPELFRHRYIGIQLKIGTEYLGLSWDQDKYGALPIPDEVILMSPDCFAYVSFTLVQDAWEAHRQECQEVTNQAKTIIESCQTSRKLVEVWPEIAPYVEPYIREGTINLPAIPVNDINQILGW